MFFQRFIFKILFFIEYLQCVEEIPKLFPLPVNLEKPKFVFLEMPRRTALGRAAECSYDGKSYDEGQEWDYYPNGDSGEQFFGFRLACSGGQAQVKGCYENKLLILLEQKANSKINKGYKAVCATNGLEYEVAEEVCPGYFVGDKFKEGFYQYECTENGPVVIACLNLSGDIVETGQEFTALGVYQMKCVDSPKGKVIEGQYCLDNGQRIDIGKSVRNEDFMKTCIEERSESGFQTAISLNVTHCCEPGVDHCIKINTEEKSILQPTYTFHCKKKDETYETYYTFEDQIVTLPETTITTSTTVPLTTTLLTTITSSLITTTSPSRITTTVVSTSKPATTLTTTEILNTTYISTSTVTSSPIPTSTKLSPSTDSSTDVTSSPSSSSTVQSTSSSVASTSVLSSILTSLATTADITNATTSLKSTSLTSQYSTSLLSTSELSSIITTAATTETTNSSPTQLNLTVSQTLPSNSVPSPSTTPTETITPTTAATITTETITPTTAATMTTETITPTTAATTPTETITPTIAATITTPETKVVLTTLPTTSLSSSTTTTTATVVASLTTSPLPTTTTVTTASTIPQSATTITTPVTSTIIETTPTISTTGATSPSLISTNSITQQTVSTTLTRSTTESTSFSLKPVNETTTTGITTTFLEEDEVGGLGGIVRTARTTVLQKNDTEGSSTFSSVASSTETCKNVVYVYVYPNDTTTVSGPQPEYRTIIVTKLVEVTQRPATEIVYVTKYIYITVKISESQVTETTTPTTITPTRKFISENETKIIYIYLTEKPLTTSLFNKTELTQLNRNQVTEENRSTQKTTTPSFVELSTKAPSANLENPNITQVITFITKYITEQITGKPETEPKLPVTPGYETKTVQVIRTSQPLPYETIVEIINNYTKSEKTDTKTEYITIVVTVTTVRNETGFSVENLPKRQNVTTVIEKYITVIVSVTPAGDKNASLETVIKYITEKSIENSVPSSTQTEKPYIKQETIIKSITEYVTARSPPLGGATENILYSTAKTVDLKPTVQTSTKVEYSIIENSRCRKDWILFGNKCFYVSPPGNRGTRDQAEEQCSRNGGRLAVIETKEEWEFLKTFLSTIQGTYPGRAFDGFWIGLYLNNQTNQWQWIKENGLKDIPWLPNPGNVRGRVAVALNVRGCGEARWDTVDWGMDKDHCMHRQWYLCDEPSVAVGLTTTPIVPTRSLEDRMRCVNNWVPFDKHCYFFSKRENRVDNKEAEKVCSNEGGYLLVINNQKEQDFVFSELESRRKQMPDESLDGYWIGIKKNNNDNSWEWTKPSDFTKSYWLPEDEMKMWELTEELKADPDRTIICGEMKYNFDRWGLDKDHCLHQEAYICEKDLMESQGDCTLWKFACPKNADCIKFVDGNKCVCKAGLLGDGYNCLDEKIFVK